MGRIACVVLLSLLYVSKISAQGKELDKLIFLYIDEKYEKCLDKGLNLIEDDDYRKSPLPYLYVSMSYYEIAKTDELVEKYPKAMKDAMKYAYKYRQKDKDMEYAGKHKDFIQTLKDSANKEAQLYYSTEDYRKAAYTYKQIVRFDPDDYLMQIWQGISEIKSRNIGEGERNLTLAMENIDDSYTPDEVVLWVASSGFTAYADYMNEKGDYAASRKGKNLAEKFRKYDPEIIKQKKAEEAKKNEPKREVKVFETSEEEAKNQKPEFIGSEKSQVKSAKEEIEQIKMEQEKEKKEEKKFKTFSSDEDEDE